MSTIRRRHRSQTRWEDSQPIILYRRAPHAPNLADRANEEVVRHLTYLIQQYFDQEHLMESMREDEQRTGIQPLDAATSLPSAVLSHNVSYWRVHIEDLLRALGLECRLDILRPLTFEQCMAMLMRSVAFRSSPQQ